MDVQRWSVTVAAGLILALTLATGPVGLLDVSTADDPVPGTGSAAVTAVSVPEEVTITAGGPGTDQFYLQVPAAIVEVTSLRGNPILEYRLHIDELGYVRTSVHFLAEDGEGTQRVVLERDSFPPDRIDRERYDGRLRMLVRGDEEAVVVDRNVTVRVDR